MRVGGSLVFVGVAYGLTTKYSKQKGCPGREVCPEPEFTVPGSLKDRMYNKVGDKNAGKTFMWPASVWSHDPWTAEEKLRAYKPRGHTGALGLIAEKMAAAAASNGSLKIVVLGGSMTQGAGLGLECATLQDRWSETLELLLKQILPPANVINLALPGTTSSHAWMNLDELVEQRPDVIIVDYAINDCITRQDQFYMHQVIGAKSAEFQRIVDMSRNLAVSLLRLPWKPGLIYLETFTHRTLFGFDCARNISEFPHWPFLREFNIPVVSYSEAACPSPNAKTLNAIWGGSCNSEGPHAPLWVHKAIAHLMAGFFQDIMQQYKSTSSLLDFPSDDMKLPAISVREVKGQACAMHPLTKYVAKPRNQGGSPSLFPSSGPAEGWSYAEDVSGKPGWLALPGSPSNIAFDVNIGSEKGGVILLEYLITYTDVGILDCWLGDVANQTWSINARVGAEVSLSELLVMQLPDSVASGPHKFSCRSDGRKFKILSLRSC